MTTTIFTRADRDLAESLFTSVASKTRQVDGNGVCRPSYGHGESVAWRVVASMAIDLGLTTGFVHFWRARPNSCAARANRYAGHSHPHIYSGARLVLADEVTRR